MTGSMYRARRRLAIWSGLVFLAACAAPGNDVDPETGFLLELPEFVAEIADPSQDLSAVLLNPADKCYWYRYSGPVETTMLPLRTRDGRPICAPPGEG